VLDVGTLISFNSIRDVRRIKAGTLLTIPPMSGILYTVRRGDSISLIAQKNGVSVNLILDANNLQSETIQPGQQLFIPGVKISRYEYDLATGQLFRYPVTGRLSSVSGTATILHGETAVSLRHRHRELGWNQSRGRAGRRGGRGGQQQRLMVITS
jgi:hypothetical protein